LSISHDKENSTIYLGDALRVTSRVRNEGNTTRDVNAVLRVYDSALGWKTIDWNLSSFAAGQEKDVSLNLDANNTDYQIVRVYATPLAGETDLTDNQLDESIRIWSVQSFIGNRWFNQALYPATDENESTEFYVADWIDNLKQSIEDFKDIHVEMDINAAYTITASRLGGIDRNYELDVNWGSSDYYYWKAKIDRPGSYNARIKVGRYPGDQNIITRAFNVLNVNDLPVIGLSSGQEFWANAGQAFVYDVNASDDDISEGYANQLTNFRFDDNSALFDINSATGLVSFTASDQNAGTYDVNIWVYDDRNAVDWKLVKFYINTAPVVNSMQTVYFNEDDSNSSLDLDTYVADDFTPDAGINWTYSVSDANVLVDINSANHVVTFRALADWNGSADVNFTATDSNGLQDTNSAQVIVKGVNDAPRFTSTAGTTASIGVLYSYDVDAFDPENNPITYGFNDLNVSGTRTFNTASGLFQWTPDANDLANSQIFITFDVNDGIDVNYQQIIVSVS
jgi:hypothetical protein